MKKLMRQEGGTRGSREVVIELDSGASISATKVGGRKDPVLELQLTMATSSINHEYARMEYDETSDRERREELLHYMEDCREKYLNAREQLLSMSPHTLERFERDLVFQKQTTLSQFHA